MSMRLPGGRCLRNAVQHPPEDLVVTDRLSLRRVGLENLLLALLQVRERPFLLRVNRGGEEDVGDVAERMRRVP